MVDSMSICQAISDSSDVIAKEIKDVRKVIEKQNKLLELIVVDMTGITLNENN